jgi:EAL domain-containing protein (putative c-di-GMP-specific phosphodiesterase class I)
MSRIREAIERYQFSWQGQNYKISASIGIAIIDEFAGNATELLKQADLACYVAKDHGRNQIHVYDAENRHISKREGEMHLVSEILAALEEGRFCLYGQPIVPLCSGGKVSYEILIRMLDREGNMVLPGAFLSSAERYGRSSDIDRWVIENTFAWAKRNSENLERIDHVAINLSGRSIGDLSILNTIEEQLQDSNLPAEFFSFEITETAAIANLKAADEFIQGIKKYGCTVALDDFGSGLSSFAYLKNLSVDYLKIDGIFVKEIAEDQIDEAMVTAINTVGHVMGLKTIAEFVESPEIQTKLQGLGIDYGQGYGIGKPIPLDEIFE